MNHNGVSSSGEKFLEQVAVAFREFRAKGGKQPSESLRAMAVSGIRMGLSRDKIAKAAGVAGISVGRWEGRTKVVRRVAAKELRLVAGPVAPRGIVTEQQPKLTSDLICIRLTSGIEIDFPRSDLNAEFLNLLSGIGGGK